MYDEGRLAKVIKSDYSLTEEEISYIEVLAISKLFHYYYTGPAANAELTGEQGKSALNILDGGLRGIQEANPGLRDIIMTLLFMYELWLDVATFGEENDQPWACIVFRTAMELIEARGNSAHILSRKAGHSDGVEDAVKYLNKKPQTKIKLKLKDYLGKNV